MSLTDSFSNGAANDKQTDPNPLAPGATWTTSYTTTATYPLPSAGVIGGSGFNLGDAANYAIIAFNPHNFQTSNDTINGNVGIGPYAGIQLTSGTLNGNLVTTGAAPTNGNGNQIQGVSGTITGNNALLASDITALKTLSTTLGTEAGTSVSLNGNTIQATSGKLDAYGNEVFTVTSWGDNITINGDGTHDVVLNVEPGANLRLGNLTLTGGLTANEVLVNDLGTSDLQSTGAHGQVFEATVLAPNAKVNYNASTVDGHVFGGAAGQDFQWNSGPTLTAPPAPPYNLVDTVTVSGTSGGTTATASNSANVTVLGYMSTVSSGNAAIASNTTLASITTPTSSNATISANSALLGQYMAGSFATSAGSLGATPIHESTSTTMLTQPQHT